MAGSELPRPLEKNWPVPYGYGEAARSMITYWHDTDVCLSVYLSVCLWCCELWLSEMSHSKSVWTSE